MQATRELCSIGYVSQLLGRSPFELMELAQSLGLGPDFVINGVAHYNPAAINALRNALAARRALPHLPRSPRPAASRG